MKNTIAKITFDDGVTPEEIEDLIDAIQEFFLHEGYIVNIQVDMEKIILDDNESEAKDEDH